MAGLLVVIVGALLLWAFTRDSVSHYRGHGNVPYWHSQGETGVGDWD